MSFYKSIEDWNRGRHGTDEKFLFTINKGVVNRQVEFRRIVSIKTGYM